MSSPLALPRPPPPPLSPTHAPSRILTTPRTSAALTPAHSLAPPTPRPRRDASLPRDTHSSHESSPITDSTEVRSSSETTAATIFSMYGDDSARHDPRPTLTPPVLDKVLPPPPPHLVETPASPISPLEGSPRKRPPSIHLRMASHDTTGTHLPADPTLQPDERLSVPSPNITVSSNSSPATLSRSSSHAYSVQGPDEEDDSYHVRATYARLDHEGVPGDGFEEGKERTRQRIVSVYSVNGLLDSAASGLSAKEESVLKGLDRYGFFMSPDSHHDTRLALLPSLPLKKLPSPTRQTSPRHPPSPPELSTLPPIPSIPKSKETSRIDKWERMMTVSDRDGGGNVAAWSFDTRKGRKLRERLYKGVPDRWRGAAWWAVLANGGQGRKGAEGRPSQQELFRRYRELVDQPSTYDIQIDLDVPRTITGHVLFHTRYGLGQRSLFHVLHSFSLLCPDCGYVQGMGPIAATLLCYLEPEKAYSCLVRLHDDFEMHTIFQPGFPGLLEALYIQERLTERLLPDVYASFEKHMISSTSYATKWYITLFANSFPFQTQLRIWDAFFFEGRDLMIVVAVAILWTLRDYLASREANFETVLSLLSSYFVVEDENVFMRWIRKTLDDKKLRADMDRWRHDWMGLVETGESGRALM